jgi:type IV pilus assembly protein PilO
VALSQRDRKNVLVLVIVIAVAAAAGFWFLWRAPKAQETAQLRAEIDSLQARVDQARRDLSGGTVEDLRRTITAYEASLGIMRQLVPAENEVPQLIDDIASRASLREVNIAEFARQAQEPGGIFDTYRYRLNVFGYYDQISEFISDVASLPRIMVPYDLSLSPADQSQMGLYGDTTGALLRAQFLVRTFVKSQAGGN